MPIAVITGGQYIIKGNPPPQFDVSTREGKQAFNDWVLSSASWGCSWTFQLKPGETEDVFKAPDWKFKRYFGGMYNVEIFDLSAYTPPSFATLPAEEQVKIQEEELAQTVEKLSEVSPPPEEQVKKQEIPIIGSTRNLIIIIVLIIIGFLVYKESIKKL
jgi:hypothetical protein